MFKFDFDIQDVEDGIDEAFNITRNKTEENKNESLQALQLPKPESFAELPIADLLDALPSLISYSPLSVPVSSPRKSVTLLRRDLFDARFQLISEGAGDAVEAEDVLNSSTKKTALGFLENPSDLVPGVYEGGLKTWECSLDLVEYLDNVQYQSNYSFAGKKILELGCGTGIPSAFIVHELFSSQSIISDHQDCPQTVIHLQDYNASVIQLVTLPNLLLAWYASSESTDFRNTLEGDIPSTTESGELPITPELKSTFLEALDKLRISIRFFSGSWNSFDPSSIIPSTSNSKQPHYNLLLTSETIYRLDSLPTLVALMQKSCVGSVTPNCELEDSTLKLQINDSSNVAPSRQSMCMIAAKVLYFGVGGGIPDFLKAVKKVGGQVETVLEKKVGVGRQILSVQWR
ncbi:hypothetical protein CPB83DRAFT_795892 [Crepidotus variabilis]|uniref:protein-histidine N-methyltransferase n=1 Tax=Crepidotus variabilis TaxID=179855 RepID=A0A9P6EAZ8_9AGAR|nr:hypothetical protein CPB83DRAFT_795892 [Crepidotus variabilis]